MTSKSRQLEAAAAAIGEARSIGLACHLGPDGDALGSMLGLGIAAAKAGKKVVASFGEPFLIPPSLRFLPRGLLVRPAEFPEEPEVMVVLDAGSPDRIGELAANANKAQTVVVLDHHVTNGGFGSVAVVDPTAAATGELVFDLLELLGWPLDQEIAQCLLTALITDTGRFQYSNTTTRTLEIAARLVAAGGRTEIVGRHVYEEVKFGYLKVAADALARAELDAELSLVWTTLLDEDVESHGVEWADTENFIDLLRTAVEADTAVLMKRMDDDRLKLSLRSRGGTDVGSLAGDLGGGGHRLAAGATVEMAPQDVIARIKSVIGNYR